MCGRYGRFSRKARLEDVLGEAIDGPEDLGARYNICPGGPDWVLRNPAGLRLDLLEWGLLPAWAKGGRAKSRPVNARAETVIEKPMFRDLVRFRRCAVPIDGYYEWRTTPSGKVPFWFRLKSGAPFFLAGLWDCWHAGKPDAVASYILMTCEPNEVTAKVHDRMPVMLHARDVARWLDPALRDASDVADLLGPYPASEMEGYAVSRLVSRPENDGPELIRPDDSARELWDAIP